MQVFIFSAQGYIHVVAARTIEDAVRVLRLETDESVTFHSSDDVPEDQRRDEIAIASSLLTTMDTTDIMPFNAKRITLSV